MMEGSGIVQLEDAWNNTIQPRCIDIIEAFLLTGVKGSQKKIISNNDQALAYKAVYDQCIQRVPFNGSEGLYRRFGETLKTFMRTHSLPNVTSAHGSYLLKAIKKEWDRFFILSKYLRKTFAYLDRFYVSYNSLKPLESVGYEAFQEILFVVVLPEISLAFVELLNSERNGMNVDRTVVSNVIEICDTLAKDDYSVLEKALLESTKNYFSQKTSVWIQEDTLSSYLIKAEKYIRDENDRIEGFLLSRSKKKLIEVIEQELLGCHEATLLEKEGCGIRSLFAQNAVDDLRRIYRLFQSLPENFKLISSIFRDYILGCAKSMIDAFVSRCEAKTDKKDDGATDPQLVRDLIDLYDVAHSISFDIFCGHIHMEKGLKDAMESILNKAFGPGEKYKMVNFLSNYCDRLLKSGGDKLSEGEIEVQLAKVASIFEFIADKDVFAENYRDSLSKRLLNQRSLSDDLERAMIAKLKLQCGAQYTAKMEGMMADLSIGVEKAAEFKKHWDQLAQDLPTNPSVDDDERPFFASLYKVDFSVTLLTNGHWPSFVNIPLALPPLTHRIPQQCLLVFERYYLSHTEHRRLKWEHALGSASMKGTFSPSVGPKKSFDFQITSLQALVLLCFNRPDRLSFSTLLSILNVEEHFLKAVLHSLSCGKYVILNRFGANGQKSDKLSSNDSFEVNENFSCPSRRIRIPMANLEDNIGNNKKIEEDRSHAIEAAIVRIMKARKTLDHQSLIGEVMAMLKTFRPEGSVIKKRIEALIEREYLERDPDDVSMYRYLA